MLHLPACPAESSSAASRPQRGLTLVELVIVVALIAIFASLAGPSFRQLVARQRVHSAASAITEALWVARAEALKRNRAVGFVFADVATDWSVPDPDGGATPLLTQAAHKSISSTTESGDAVQFTFNAYGRLSSGTGWIELSDAGAGIYRCLTVATTGRATSAEGKCA
jgi:prepilin-type N-terminal cleavage/methylation domain-containing protein